MKITEKRAVVTGGTGFIGSHLVEMLAGTGVKVRALNEYNSFNSWGWLDHVIGLDNIEVMSGDIRDPHFCDHLTEGCHIVFHLAALIAIPYSYLAPDSYIDTNVKGTLNMCQAALRNGINKFVNVSTSEVYGTARYVPIDENHPLQPQSPYSASKIGAEAIAKSFYHSFGLPLVVARPFNTYGPRQSARAVIPAIIAQMAAGKREIDLGDVTPTRDLNYVTDTCRGLIALCECDEAIGETVNIGSNFEVSILDVFMMIKEIMGVHAVIKPDEKRMRPAMSEVRRLWCDNGKIERLTGFKPSFGIKEGLELTVEWFKNCENLAKYKAEVYNA